MTVNIIHRTPFESKTYKYVKKIEVSPDGNDIIITCHYPNEDEFPVTVDRHEVVLNVNTREA